MDWWLRHRFANQAKTRLRSSLRVLTTWSRDGRRFSQRVGPIPRVSPLISQVAFHRQASGTVFNIADVSKGFHGSCRDLVSFPERMLTLSRFSASFVWLIPQNENARATRPVLMHSSNHLPSGNCDLLRTETSLSYLTRFGTVSHRSSPLSSFFAFTDDARTSPEELVNSASAPGPCSPA